MHLYGNNVDIENIYHFCKNNIFVGGLYNLLDLKQIYIYYSKCQCFFTYPSKTLGGVGDGGFITINEKENL